MNKKVDPLNKLDPYFLSYNKIDQNTNYRTFYIEPERLINRKRIDILVKYYYIKSMETGKNMDFAREIYEKHIGAFSDGTFKEHGNIEKNSIDKYIESFNNLIDNFKENGFDEEISIIPIGKDDEVLDGSHRSACALYFNKKVRVVKFPDISVDYGFEFFKKRLLDDFYLDFIAKEYVNLKKEVYALFVWPKIGRDENIKYIEKHLIGDKCSIIYKKRLRMDKKELWNLVFNIYKEEVWIGHNRNNFKSVTYKRDLCYHKDGFLKVYILDCPKVEDLSEKKNLLRGFFGVEKSSIHTTDTHEESIGILNIVLDENCDRILYEDFLKIKDRDYTFEKYIKRKIRYLYRRTINIIKNIIGKPI